MDGLGLAVRLIADLDLIFCGYPLEWCSLKSGRLFQWSRQDVRFYSMYKMAKTYIRGLHILYSKRSNLISWS